MKNNRSFPSLFYQTSVIMIVLIVLIAGSATPVTAQEAPSPLEKTINEPSAYGKFGPDTTIRVDKGASAIAVGGGAVWVLAGGKLLQIDPYLNQVVAIIPEVGGALFSNMGVGDGSVWVPRGDIFSPGMKRIDVTTRQVAATIPVVGNHVAIGHGSVWATSMKKGTLSRIDPSTNQIVATIAVGRSLTFVAADESAVWVLNNDDGTVSRIDPNTNQVVATVKFGPGSTIWKTLLSQYPAAYFGFAAGAGAVWVTAYKHGVVLCIDLESNEVARAVPVGIKPSLVAVCGSTVWVETDSTLLRIDPKTERVVETIQLVGAPGQRKMAAMASSQDAVWAIPGPMVGDRVERINFRP